MLALALVQVSRAVERLLLDDIVPNLDDWVAADHQAFRRDVCYTEAVDVALRKHEESLTVIFNHFAGTEAGIGSKKQSSVMKLTDWVDMVCSRASLANMPNEHTTTHHHSR